MGSAWYVSPLTADQARSLADEGVRVPPGLGPSAAPSLDQVLAALAAFPEYRVSVRRQDREGKGQAVSVELRRADDSPAIGIRLLRVAAADRPAGVFAFDYYRAVPELVRLVAQVAEACGPLVLWHDGGERSVLVTPPSRAEPGAAADRAGTGR